MSNPFVEALRGTFIHHLYRTARYEMPDVFRNRIAANIRRRRYGKIANYFGYLAKNKFTDLPGKVAIDIVSVCNLRCPLCSVPPDLTKIDGKFMGLDKYKEIVDKIGDAVPELVLVYAGEPFLHPDFEEMLQYAADKYYLNTITNGTLLDQERIDLILRSIDYLSISFDGYDKQSYEKYRVGAKYENVKANINNLLEQRRKKKLKHPLITITYLINGYNESGVKQSRKYWLGKGADRFNAKYINLNVHRRSDEKKEEDLSHWLPKDKEHSLYDAENDGIRFKDHSRKCTSYFTPIIRNDGQILFCCHDIFNTVKLGNILNTPLRETWNSPEYIRARKLASARQLPICRKCGK